MKNGVARTRAMNMISFEVKKSIFRPISGRCRKNRARNCPVYHTTAWPAVAPNKARRMSFQFLRLARASGKGFLELPPVAFQRVDRGVSLSLHRVDREIGTR